ncbi:uncharacterized protein MYCFIDRAFT_178889 [Pseudocercospora fijiensis CIRAD86]|uniref:SET domain-containing protein n=1 Tax=Pseudocercospora fijiensis (strain CIRAD86) TaxID=383855 RepID=M2YM38_PSEFD|nr:uncharacterized protein MYCFIDRAFT_178889 [Pseudocercospora fijiensis CIRAD86]EME78785.1 hypothetical protein MYCFIDRAFT_178889 [Pseudocercospora fijiensis CIRAD86]
MYVLLCDGKRCIRCGRGARGARRVGIVVNNNFIVDCGLWTLLLPVRFSFLSPTTPPSPPLPFPPPQSHQRPQRLRPSSSGIDTISHPIRQYGSRHTKSHIANTPATSTMGQLTMNTDQNSAPYLAPPSLTKTSFTLSSWLDLPCPLIQDLNSSRWYIMSLVLCEPSQSKFWLLQFPVSFVRFCFFASVRLPSPPENILEHRFEKKAWYGHRITREKKDRKGRRLRILPKSIEETLLNEFPDPCLQCKFDPLDCEKVDDDDCGIKCVEEFRRRHFFKYKPQIQPSGSCGYGAFNTRSPIPADTYLSEYLGNLIPSDDAPRSLYLLDIKGLFSIDAAKAGNWTRFINSSCEPNVAAEAAMLGKRHVLVFKTLRRILPGEELTFYYGRKYFQQAGFKCSCPWRDEPHTPRSNKQAEEHDDAKGKGNKTNTSESPDVSTGEDTEETVTPAAPRKPSSAEGKKRSTAKKTKTSTGSPSAGKKVSSGRVTKRSHLNQSTNATRSRTYRTAKALVTNL